MNRIAVLGGAFDPPHIGHLLLAQWALEELGVDRVVFMPYFSSAYKRPVASAEDRVEMVRLAIAGIDGFELDTREVERGGITYTIDTVEDLLKERPGLEIYWLLGADALRGLPSWKDWEKLVKLVKFAVATRHSEGLADQLRDMVGVVYLSMPRMEISSSLIRERLRQGLSVRFLVPDEVEAYIKRHGLYSGERA